MRISSDARLEIITNLSEIIIDHTIGKGDKQPHFL